jgi:tetratricopeptide (TPR) repeat protein
VTALPQPDERRSERLAGLAVVVAAFLAYATALAGTFVFDDIHSVAGNPGVQTLANLGRFFVDPNLFSAIGNAMYRPVLLCTFAVDHAAGGGSAVPFKLTNVALHATTAWLLFGLLRAHAVGRAAAVAAAILFAVHPLASEAVNMVSGRSELLCVLGLLLGLRGHLAWLRGSRAPLRGSRAPLRGPGAFAFATAAGAVLACGSKETGVLLPALLLAQQLIVAGWPRGRTALRVAVARLLPAVVVTVVYLAARKALLGQATVALAGRAGNDPMYGHTRDLLTQLSTMAAALPRVLLQVVWPAGLSLDPEVVYYRTPLSWPPLVGAAGLLSWTWLGLCAPRQRPARTLGTVLAWATALPWVVIPLNLPIAEHRCYGPLAGLAAALGAALDHSPWFRRAALWRGWRCACSVRTWLVAAPALAFALLAAQRSLDYRDECALWRRVLAQRDGSFRAHWGLGAALLLRGEPAAAETELAHAVAIYPAFRTARRTWIECMLQLPPAEGWPFRALVVAEELTRQKGDDPWYRMLHAHAELEFGIASGDRRAIADAEQRALSCLQIAPPKGLVWRVAARCRRELGDPQGALAHFDTALEHGFDQPALRAERAEALRALGRAGEADRELRAAFARAPFDPAVRAAMERRDAVPPR